MIPLRRVLVGLIASVVVLALAFGEPTDPGATNSPDILVNLND